MAKKQKKDNDSYVILKPIVFGSLTELGVGDVFPGSSIRPSVLANLQTRNLIKPLEDALVEADNNDPEPAPDSSNFKDEGESDDDFER